MGEETYLYRLQSYYIYKAQMKPEPWGTQDGNNLQSRFAWSYAAFERSDTAGSTGRGAGRDAELHLCGRYHRCFLHYPTLASALIRARVIPERIEVNVYLPLSKPDSPKGVFGGVWGFVCATKYGQLHPFSCQQSGDSSVPSY